MVVTRPSFDRSHFGQAVFGLDLVDAFASRPDPTNDMAWIRPDLAMTALTKRSSWRRPIGQRSSISINLFSPGPRR
jgi:hypothetical protein